MTRKTFVREYSLLADTPKTKSGCHVYWNPFAKLYCTTTDGTGEKFDIQTVESRPDWFRKVSEEIPWRAEFPDDITNHFHGPELRHNAMCQFCGAARQIVESPEFYARVVAVLREMYEAMDDEHHATDGVEGNDD